MSIIEYIKKNYSMAKKTIFWDFGRYACFFVLLFLLQCLFSTVLVLRVNNFQTQKAYLEEQYTNQQGYVYHMTLQGLSGRQYSYVLAAERAQAPKDAEDLTEEQKSENYYFTVVGGTQYTRYLTDGTTYLVYDLDIQFLKDNLKSCYNRFSDAHFARLEEMNERTKFVCVPTPLLNASMDAALHQAGTVLLVIFLLALSTLMLWVLRSTLTSHYRFTYGIYLSFGATFGRLFMTALFEMLILNAMLFLPSALTAHLAAWLIHRRSGLPFSVQIGMVFLSLAITLTASLIAVFIDFRRTASRPPVRLLASADNADVISSPKTSADVFTRAFPEGFERLTRVRFRKYIAGLLSFALLFAVLSTGASYLSSLVRMEMDSPSPEYSLVFTPTIANIKSPAEDDPPKDSETTGPPTEAPGTAGEDTAPPDSSAEGGKDGPDGDETTETVISYDYTFDGEVAEIISSLPGIGWIRKTCATAASDFNSHVLIPKSRVKKSAGGVALESERAFANVKYCVLDKQVVAALTADGVRVKGSLSDVLESDNVIAISDSFNNTRQFKLKVGDTIRIAYTYEVKGGGSHYEPTNILAQSGSDLLLRDSLEKCNFLYRTYTVGAILGDLATEGDFPIYLSGKDYTKLTGNDIHFTEAQIVLAGDATPEDLRRLDAGLRGMKDALSNLTLTDLDHAVQRQVSENKNPTSILLFLAGVLLAASPLIWILSQTLFYLRRRQEMRLYLSMGANLSQVKKLFYSDGLFFGLSGMGVYLVLSTLFTLLIHKLANNPYIYRLITGEAEAFFFRYRFPWLTIGIGTLVMGISGWISVYLSWRSFERSCPTVFGGKGLPENGRKQKNRKERK